MVVHDISVIRIAIFKPEADTPLVVDANAPLTDSIAAQAFQVVRRWQAQILYVHGRMQLGQAHQRASKDVGRQAPRLPGQKRTFSFWIGKVFNHNAIINNLFTKQQIQKQAHA